MLKIPLFYSFLAKKNSNCDVTVARFVIALRPKQMGDARYGFKIGASDILDLSYMRQAETSDRQNYGLTGHTDF